MLNATVDMRYVAHSFNSADSPILLYELLCCLFSVKSDVSVTLMSVIDSEKTFVNKMKLKLLIT